MIERFKTWATEHPIWGIIVLFNIYSAAVWAIGLVSAFVLSRSGLYDLIPGLLPPIAVIYQAIYLLIGISVVIVGPTAILVICIQEIREWRKDRGING